jgi:hypothetical protein
MFLQYIHSCEEVLCHLGFVSLFLRSLQSSFAVSFNLLLAVLRFLASLWGECYGLIDLEVHKWALPVDLHLALMLAGPLSPKPTHTLSCFALLCDTLFDIEHQNDIFVGIGI